MNTQTLTAPSPALLYTIAVRRYQRLVDMRAPRVILKNSSQHVHKRLSQWLESLSKN